MNMQAPSESTTIIRNARCRPKNWKLLALHNEIKTVYGLETKICDITWTESSKNNENTLIVFTGYYMEHANEIQWIERWNENI